MSAPPLPVCVVLHLPQPSLWLLTAPGEVEIIRKEYGEAVAAYGCLGVLQVAQGKTVYHYLVLVTDCLSVGKVSTIRVINFASVIGIERQLAPAPRVHVYTAGNLLQLHVHSA